MKQPLKICKIYVNYNWDEKDQSYRKSRLVGMTTLPFRINSGSLSHDHSWEVVEEMLADGNPFFSYSKIQSGPIKETFDFLNSLSHSEFRVTVGTPEPHWIMPSKLQWQQSVDDFEITEFDQQNVNPPMSANDYSAYLIVVPLGQKDVL